MNILKFNEAIKDISLKYNMQDIDVIDIFVKTAETVFNTSLSLVNKETIYLVKNKDNKRINLTANTLKKINSVFEFNLQNLNKKNQIQIAKKLLQRKSVIMFEVIKIYEDYLLCTFQNINAKLPFKNIPSPDIEQYTCGSMHYGLVHSYSFANNEVILNCKHPQVDIKKVQGVITSVLITRVNRYYGKRIKIYAIELPSKVQMKNAKEFFPKEKLIFFKDKNYE